MRQRHVCDRRVEPLHDVGEHDRDGQSPAIGHGRARLALHRALSAYRHRWCQRAPARTDLAGEIKAAFPPGMILGLMPSAKSSAHHRRRPQKRTNLALRAIAGLPVVNSMGRAAMLVRAPTNSHNFGRLLFAERRFACRSAEEAPLPETLPGSIATMIEALIAIADRQLWARYCRLVAELEDGGRDATPVYAIGSLEAQQQAQRPARGRQPLTAEEGAAGRRRLAQRSGALAFAGAPSPLGAAEGAAFDEFLARHRGQPALLAEINEVERELVSGFELAGRRGRYRAAGFYDGARRARRGLVRPSAARFWPERGRVARRLRDRRRRGDDRGRPDIRRTGARAPGAGDAARGVDQVVGARRVHRRNRQRKGPGAGVARARSVRFGSRPTVSKAPKPFASSAKRSTCRFRPHARLSTGRPVLQYAGNECCAGLDGAEPHA